MVGLHQGGRALRSLGMVSFALVLGCNYYEVPFSTYCDDPHDPRLDRTDGGAADGARPVERCRTDGECPIGTACVDGACERALPCASDADCGAAERCDVARATCVPDVGDGCTSLADCMRGEVCVERACVPLDSACSSDLDCGPGRGCVDNACRPMCTADAECAPGDACIGAHCVPGPDECADDTGCLDGEPCIAGRCAAACTIGTCDVGEMCEGGRCVADVAPRPYCTSDRDCAPGHPCVDGVCRTVCPSGTDEECQRADVQLSSCVEASGVLLCLARSEAVPECVTRADCGSGEHCIDARCR